MNARAIAENALADIAMPKALRQTIIDRLEALILDTLVRGRRLARQSMRTRRRGRVHEPKAI